MDLPASNHQVQIGANIKKTGTIHTVQFPDEIGFRKQRHCT
jgi:hypothetical protein